LNWRSPTLILRLRSLISRKMAPGPQTTESWTLTRGSTRTGKRGNRTEGLARGVALPYPTTAPTRDPAADSQAKRRRQTPGAAVAAASGLGFRDTARRVRIGALSPGRRRPASGRAGRDSSAESDSVVSPSDKGSSSGLGASPAMARRSAVTCPRVRIAWGAPCLQNAVRATRELGFSVILWLPLVLLFVLQKLNQPNGATFF
jgi:hypothetical protein